MNLITNGRFAEKVLHPWTSDTSGNVHPPVTDRDITTGEGFNWIRLPPEVSINQTFDISTAQDELSFWLRLKARMVGQPRSVPDNCESMALPPAPTAEQIKEATSKDSRPPIGYLIARCSFGRPDGGSSNYIDFLYFYAWRELHNLEMIARPPVGPPWISAEVNLWCRPYRSNDPDYAHSDVILTDIVLTPYPPSA